MNISVSCPIIHRALFKLSLTQDYNSNIAAHDKETHVEDSADEQIKVSVVPSSYTVANLKDAPL